MWGNQVQVSFSRKSFKKAYRKIRALKVSRGTQNGQKKRETLVSDHILLKWSLTKAVLILVPLKKPPCLKCPE